MGRSLQSVNFLLPRKPDLLDNPRQALKIAHNG